jgi:nucleotide-binding universal stress UspA family protein
MRVLVGIADSKSAEQVLQTVVTQLSPAKTEVRLLHVLQPISVSSPPQMDRAFTPELEAEKKAAQELIDSITARVANAGFKVDALIEKGDVRETIIDAAAQWHADLIVIGSRGAASVNRFLLGSVAESVIRHASCSVQVVRCAA